jgi:hypothetical protein
MQAKAPAPVRRVSMPTYLVFVVVGLVVAGLIAWSLVRHQQSHRGRKAALERMGFRPCPDQKGWLDETVARLENAHRSSYEVRDPQQLQGERSVYCYVRMRDRHDEHAEAEEQILFPLKRPSTAGLVLTVKPSSLAPGLATRMLGALATAPWDTQPDDLQPLELPADLKDTNLLAALGPPGARLYELVDAGTLAAVQGLGDAGGMFVRFRDAWCSVGGASAQIPFRLEELIARIRPLL